MTVQTEEEEYVAELIESLTPRQRQVVCLVGGQRLSYEEAARRMGHFYQGNRSISPETVRRYASDIRDLFGVDKPAQRAMWDIFVRARQTGVTWVSGT